MLAALLNGQPIDGNEPAIHVDDRGWQYGDGLFETMLLANGRVRFFEDHLQRLALGCERLRIERPDRRELQNEIEQLVGPHHEGVIKLILTRGRSGRGYRPNPAAMPTRLLQLFESPRRSAQNLTVRWCATRYARNALLAGIKHLNRLEQVLAQAEWNDSVIAEGLMLDTEGELISGTMTNVFLLLEGVLVTPDLRYSGINGVMRKNILRLADTLGIPIEERAVWPQELLVAQELFVTNVVRGIQPVTKLMNESSVEREWDLGANTMHLASALKNITA